MTLLIINILFFSPPKPSSLAHSCFGFENSPGQKSSSYTCSESLQKERFGAGVVGRRYGLLAIILWGQRAPLALARIHPSVRPSVRPSVQVVDYLERNSVDPGGAATVRLDVQDSEMPKGILVKMGGFYRTH